MCANLFTSVVREKNAVTAVVGNNMLLIMSKSVRGLDTGRGWDLYPRARVEVICVFIYSYLSASLLDSAYRFQRKLVRSCHRDEL